VLWVSFACDLVRGGCTCATVLVSFTGVAGVTGVLLELQPGDVTLHVAAQYVPCALRTAAELAAASAVIQKTSPQTGLCDDTCAAVAG